MLLQETSQLFSGQAALVIGTILVGGTAYLAYFLTQRSPAAEPIAILPTDSSDKRQITRKEVAAHSAADDLWIILKNQQSGKLSVYDITAYVEEHPGGQAILNNAGRDSTKGFYGPQHPARVFDMIEDYYIGDLQQ